MRTCISWAALIQTIIKIYSLDTILQVTPIITCMELEPLELTLKPFQMLEVVKRNRFAYGPLRTIQMHRRCVCT